MACEASHWRRQAKTVGKKELKRMVDLMCVEFPGCSKNRSIMRKRENDYIGHAFVAC